MQIRTKTMPGTMSIQLTQEEWNKIKADGDAVFNKDNLNYMQIAETKIFFSDNSPYFKDFKKDNKKT